MLRMASRRIAQTDAPCIVQMQQMMKGKEGLLSLAQGIVHWQPPTQAIDAARSAIELPATNMYGADDGLPELRTAIKSKLATQNKLVASDVMVTAGANQAYLNVVLTLLDSGDAACLFRPYYFNHLMALQMTGSASDLFLPNALPDLQPDLDALRTEFETRASTKDQKQLKMLTLVNPGNPTGVMIPKATLQAASELCAQYGAWLVVDNTYEHFAYEGCAEHECIEGDHVINLFSFSKAYGMMGWRVGYIAHPPSLAPELLKVQDTVVICPTVVSQRVALGALEAGADWVAERVHGLAQQKQLVLDALQPLGASAVQGGSGAIYVVVRLPEGFDDVEAVRWLAEEHKVVLIPGTSCGMPGYVRVCYANLPLEKTREAAERLKRGLAAIADARDGGNAAPWVH